MHKQQNTAKLFNLLTLIPFAMASGCVVEHTRSDQQTSSLLDIGSSGGQASEAVSKEHPHCVTRAIAQRRGDPTPSKMETVPIACFETFAAAISVATYGNVQLSPSDTPDVLDIPDVERDLMLETYLVAIEYEAPAFGSYTLTVSSNVSCSDANLFINGMPAGWNDVISSSKTFSSCTQSYHYEHVNFLGAVLNCDAGCSNMGALNNHTSSIYWCGDRPC